MTLASLQPDKPGYLLGADAACLRVAAQAEGAGAEDWLHYGEALRKLGFAGRARAVWRKGHARFPSDTALTLALTLPPSASAEPRRRDPHGVHIHLSARQAAFDETDRAGLACDLGRSDYSYGFAMRGFLSGLAAAGMPHSIVRHPERIADIRARSTAACNIHLGFYPPEHLRLLKGAYNIACFAWEFDRLRDPTEATSTHAFADQATMLRLPDALWMPSTHGVAAVGTSVAKPIGFVPAPVPADPEARIGRPAADRIAGFARLLGAVPWQPLAILPRAQADMDRMAARQRCGLAKIVEGSGIGAAPIPFVTVLNVHDYRKQLRPMLHAFAQLRASHPNAVLLIKASTPHRDVQPIASFLLAEQLAEPGTRTQAIVSDRIWITDAALTRAEMDHLFDSAAFYLCTSHAEGQNLPLLEAMGRGVVPVSVDHTAMADYIRADNAIMIRSTRRPLGLRLSRRYGLYGIETNFVDPADVTEALLRAIGLPTADYAARSAEAMATVRRDYGPSRLIAAIGAAVRAARGDPGLLSHG